MSADQTHEKPRLIWVPWVVAFGGLGLAIWGSINSNMPAFIAGVVVLFGSTLASRALVSRGAADMDAWAEAAINGQGPVPPRDAQQELLERARHSDAETQEEIKTAFEEECRRWSAEQQSAT